jgi:hypothetical protein
MLDMGFDESGHGKSQPAERHVDIRRQHAGQCVGKPGSGRVRIVLDDCQVPPAGEDMLSERAGVAAQALQKAKIAADIKFDRDTALLSSEDVQIAQQQALSRRRNRSAAWRRRASASIMR